MAKGNRLMQLSTYYRACVVTLCLIGIGLAPTHGWASKRIGSICRVKGQEENTLHGWGLVVGLSGTGDGSSPLTMRMLAGMLENMGQPITRDATGVLNGDLLKEAKNVALVHVSATVPAAGAQQGALLRCAVSAIGAKSLAGGRLVETPLVGPRPGDPMIFALAKGPLVVETDSLTSASVHQGCVMQQSVENGFTQHGMVHLVLDRAHAGFHTAQEVENTLNTSKALQHSGGAIATAMDQTTISVRIPEAYATNPVQFVSLLLETRMMGYQEMPRVVINERTGTVVMTEDVELAGIAVSHKNLTINTQAGQEVNPLRLIDPSLSSQQSVPTLQDLVKALEALEVSSVDLIQILKTLEATGALYAQVIIVK